MRSTTERTNTFPRPSARQIRAALDRLPSLQQIAADLTHAEFQDCERPDRDAVLTFARDAATTVLEALNILALVEANPRLRDDAGQQAIQAVLGASAHASGTCPYLMTETLLRQFGYRVESMTLVPLDEEPVTVH